MAGGFLLPSVAKIEAQLRPEKTEQEEIRQQERVRTIKIVRMENVKGSERKTKRPKGGRPKKTVKKSEIMMLRLTPSERETIQKKAATAGMNPCEWIRQSALKAVIIPRLNPEETGYLRSLSGMANNLNQLVKLAHTQGLLSLSLQCCKYMEQVDLLIEKLVRS